MATQRPRVRECAKSSDVYSAVVLSRFHRIILAAVLMPLAVMVGLRSAWAAYACRIDGEVRDACCCPKPEKERDHAPADEAPGITASCCCDVTIGETAANPQAHTAEQFNANDCFVGGVIADEVEVVAFVTASACWHALARPPPRSVPTYLANRSILR